MINSIPEEKIRAVIEACSDCDVCRHLMDVDCLFFPQLYRLWDQEQETGEPASSRDLRDLTDRCNFCALCPCPNIRADIIDAKTTVIARDGLGLVSGPLKRWSASVRFAALFRKCSMPCCAIAGPAAV